MTVHGGEDEALVIAAVQGDEQAFGRLFDRWFDPVYDIAWRITRDKETAADVAQDVFLAAWRGIGDLEQPGSFGGWVRRIARNRALNRLEREQRSRPDTDAAEAALDRRAPDVDMTAALDEHEQRELVWAAAAALGERDASLLDLHLRHGLPVADIAAELGVTANNAHQLLHRLKSKLGAAVRAWVLWRRADACAGLDAAIADADLSSFGADAVRVIGRHARDCSGCRERQQLSLAPEALFAAVPIAVAPPTLKSAAAAALAAEGVPMTGASGSPAGVGGPGEGSEASGPGGSGADHGSGEGGEPGGSGDPHVPGEPHGSGSEVAVGGNGQTPAEAGAAVAASGPLVVAPGSPGRASPDGGTSTSRPTNGDPGAGRRRRLVLVALAVATAVVGIAVLLTSGGRDEATTSRETTETPSTTTSSSTTTSTTAPADAGAPGPVVGSADPETTAAPPTEPPDTTTTTSTTTTTTTTAPPPPAPVIDDLSTSAPGDPCGSTPNAHEVTLTWSTQNATEVAVAGQSDLPASGSTVVCASPGDQVTLEATGPGGVAEQTITILSGARSR